MGKTTRGRIETCCSRPNDTSQEDLRHSLPHSYLTKTQEKCLFPACGCPRMPPPRGTHFSTSQAWLNPPSRITPSLPNTPYQTALLCIEERRSQQPVKCTSKQYLQPPSQEVKPEFRKTTRSKIRWINVLAERCLQGTCWPFKQGISSCYVFIPMIILEPLCGAARGPQQRQRLLLR